MSYMDPRFHLRRPTLLFSLNDKELAIAKSLRHRGQRYMLVVLLGYFKSQAGGAESRLSSDQAGPQIRLSNRSTGPSCRPLISRQRERTDLPTCFPALQLPALECQRPWSGVERLLIPASQSLDSA